MVPGQSLQQTRRPTTGYTEDIAKILTEKNSLSGLYNHCQDHLIKPYNYQEKSSQVAFICQQNVTSHNFAIILSAESVLSCPLLLVVRDNYLS